MSGLEDSAKKFLQRWSRRKLALGADPADGAELPSQERKDDANAGAASGDAAQSEAALPGFDPATLPPLESISAASDIRAFLAPGVPEELTRAALRRVWVTDPTIRDFVGLAENQWDFTKSDGVPGFGSLELTPELRRAIVGVIGDARERTAAAEPDQQAAEIAAELLPPATAAATKGGAMHAGQSEAYGNLASCETVPAAAAEVAAPASNDDAAMQTNVGASSVPPSAHRKHGGAVPK